MTAFRPPPARHWRSYGTEPLPEPTEALDLPLRAFPSWFLKITCDRCGKDRMLNETHAPGRQRDMPLRVLIARARHDGCGGVLRQVGANISLAGRGGWNCSPASTV